MRGLDTPRGPEFRCVKSRMLVAGVSLGVGIVSLGVAAVLFLTHGGAKPPATTAMAAAR